MLSALTPAAQTFLTGIANIEQRYLTAQDELTTGRKINTVQDAPSEIPQLFETQQELNHVQQINNNLAQVKNETDTSEGALEQAVTLVDQAESLGTQGQSGFLSSSSQQQVAQQLGAILQQLGAIANTNVGGRYVFSGDSDQTPPYTIDLSQANPVSAYQGSASTRQVESTDGSKFSVALTAQQIFDSSDPTKNVFQSIVGLQAALSSGNAAGITTALANLKTSDSYLNQQLEFYGNAQDQVNYSISNGSTVVTRLETQLTGLQNADETQAITNFESATTQLQAALQSQAQIPKSTLFNYLG